MYRAGMNEDDIKQAAAFGFLPEDYGSGDFEVWPDNWEYVKLFNTLGTQWRVGVNGATGLDYTAIRNAFVMMGVPRIKWPDMFDAMQLMEVEALGEMRGS